MLVLLERVTEAQRIASKELREMQSADASKKGKKRGRDRDHDSRDAEAEDADTIVKSVLKKGNKRGKVRKR